MDRMHKTFFISSLTAIRHQVDALESMILALNNDRPPPPRPPVQNMDIPVYTTQEFDDSLGEVFDNLANSIEVVGDK